MKVLVVHARYRQPGGEDTVVDVQTSALTGLGHQVVRFDRSNEGIEVATPLQVGSTAITSIWSRRARRELADTIADERPDIVHVHNTFPILSPSVYAAANEAGVPVVQHLHNARLVCTNPNLIRNGSACTDCLGRRVPWPGVIHRCYHDSLTHTTLASALQVTHRALGTWWRRVDLFLPVSKWLSDTLTQAGAVPGSRVLVCPSALDPDPGERPPLSQGDSSPIYALFSGRLSPEKGLDTLVAAASKVPELTLLIAGDGPDRARLERSIATAGTDHIQVLGHVDRPRLMELVRGARVVVVPSISDSLPMALLEAAASGVPVIGTTCGGIPEALIDGVTGHLVPPGDVVALARQLANAAAHPTEMASMGSAARELFERSFAAPVFAKRLVSAYAQATENARTAGRSRGVGPVTRSARATAHSTGRLS